MRHSRFAHLKPEVLRLRKAGLSYLEIRQKLAADIPLGTLSNWCSRIRLSAQAFNRLRKRMPWSPQRKALVSQMAAEKRQRRRDSIHASSRPLAEELADINVAKIALAMLYLGEGKKDERDIVSFGNSNAGIVSLFMRLFRKVYETDVAKFRVVIGCRADQDIPALEAFWREAIDIPGIRFYRTRIDPRTLGKPTQKTAIKAFAVSAILIIESSSN